MSRTTEMALGIIGGLFAVIAAVIVAFFGAVDETISGSSEMADAGGLSFWMALLGLVAACLVKLKNITKICGIVMIISGAIVAWNTGLFGIIGAIFLIIGGGLSLRKDKTNETKDVAA